MINTFLNNFGKSGKPVTDLSRIKSLLEQLDNPQKKLKFIHIAGTNGKGSVLEMISGALICSGYKTGQLTSPFVRRYNDRIRINGIEIPDKALDYYCNLISKKNISQDFSQFEITFAIALLYFVDEKCDIVVLEAGIGGLLDATNIIENPLVSVITTISYDHMAILGNTLSEIASQKAGIIKPNCACVVMSGLEQSAFEVIKNKAISEKSKLIVPDENLFEFIKSEADGVTFLYKNKIYKTAMPGIHQMKNSEVAITSLEYLRDYKNLSIDDEKIKYSIENSKVEGRIQLLQKEPSIVYLDGGHNIEGAMALCNFLNNNELPQPKTAIVGMIKTKDYKSVCKIFSDNFDKIICIGGFSPNEVKKEVLAELFPKEKVTAMTLEKSLGIALKNHQGTTVICGSLYVVSEVLKKLK